MREWIQWLLGWWWSTPSHNVVLADSWDEAIKVHQQMAVYIGNQPTGFHAVQLSPRMWRVSPLWKSSPAWFGGI
jgi:hypothetical protein